VDTLDAIRQRRSVRRFLSDPVPDDVLKVVLEAGGWAPSWKNTQCWQLVLVTDPAVKGRLADAMPPTNPGAAAVRNAPATIAVCAELGKSGYSGGAPRTEKGEWWYMFDTALCVENMCLAAAGLGLGTLIIGLADHAALGSILKLPSGVVSVVLVPLGYPDPANPPKVTARRGLAEFVSKNEYGVK